MRHLAAVGYLNEIGRDTYETTHFTKAMSNKTIGESFPAMWVASIQTKKGRLLT
jgi:hypothetical protein